MSTYTLAEKCPECGSDNIQVIDRGFDDEDQTLKNRCTCWDCDHDWWETEED